MDEVISSQEEMERLLKSFQVVGGGNTDFRPAFTYVNQLIKEGSIRHLDNPDSTSSKEAVLLG